MFANSSSVPKTNNGKGYNNSGWIYSLQQYLEKIDEVSLAICSLASTTERIEVDKVMYYLVKENRKSFLEKITTGVRPRNMSWEYTQWDYYKYEFDRVICDFSPDVIHVFGSEFCYGLVSEVTQIPVVVHIQGILTPCFNALFPPGVSLMNYVCQSLKPNKIWSRLQGYYEWFRLCEREKEIFEHVKYFIGRTGWDKSCLSLLSPDAKYYFGGEILRSVFYTANERLLPADLVIVTTISYPTYKGFDVILKTAKLLKNMFGNGFVWKVFGNLDPSFFEKNTGISHSDVNVELCGVASAEELRNQLLNSTVYYHSSYIENSSNSVSEAQILGIPVVACMVGGMDDCVQNNVDGFLVPANDPYRSAYRLLQLYNDKELNLHMGDVGRKHALDRHNPDLILKGLMDIYIDITNKNKLI